MENLPADLSEARREVVLTAYQLLGRVHYFWGGKSLVIGWDSRWGMPMEVTAEGSSTTGTVRPFGLDCSGMVDWVFYNQSGGQYVIGHGGGATAQHSYCTPIAWSDAQPGDLVFYPGDSHVGICLLYTSIAPIPLASFAGQPSSSIGVAFLKSYAAICLEGCVIVLACVIFSAFASSPPAIADDTLAAATIVWNYVGELIFNMLVLVGAIKMSDRIIRELMGLG